MSVGDVANLVGHIEGFNQRMMHDYRQRLIDSNINGAVLASCDLAELKPVLQMAFGDWVLFRSLIESLRYNEQTYESFDTETSTPMAGFVQSTACDAGKVGAKSMSAAPTVGVTDNVTSSSNKATSDMTLTSVSNADMVSAAQSRSSPTLKDLTTAGDRDVTDDVKPVVASSPHSHRTLNRQDSFVNEVLMESETIHGFIQASVVGSASEGNTPDSDDEVQRPITTIPEEPPVASRNASASSLGHHSLRQMSVARQMSVESGPVDRAFSVGPDHDSGESDSEVERISRKSSIRHAAIAHSVAGSKPETDAAQGSSTTEDRKKKLSSKSMKHTADSHRPSLKTADKSKSNSASRLDKGGNECAVPLMSLYFSMACDGTRTESQTSSGSSPRASGHAAPTSSSSSDGSPPTKDSEFSCTCPVAVTGHSSSQHDTSSVPASHPQPTSSAATNVPSSVSTPSQPTELTEATASDSVKFFIVDELDSSPKAIMVEMESLPPHRVISSAASDRSSRYDSDHAVL